MRAKQQSFLKALPKYYGGDHLKGRRKTYRPIDPRKPLHLVMRSSIAKGELSLLHPKRVRHVEKLVRERAAKWGIKVDQYVNVGNHLHLQVRTPSKKSFHRFLKELAGAVAMMVTGARKGAASAFWDGRAFTRIVEWGRDLENLKLYFIQNLFESAGGLSRRMKAAGVRPIVLFGKVSGVGPPGGPGYSSFT